MAKTGNSKKADQKEQGVSVDDLKEMKSHALTIPRKLDDARFDIMPNVIEESQALVDRFYQSRKHLMTPQQYAFAQHNFEYFLWLLDLAIHNAAKSDQRQK
jgi:hypothetical protein